VKTLTDLLKVLSANTVTSYWKD